MPRTAMETIVTGLAAPPSSISATETSAEAMMVTSSGIDPLRWSQRMVA
jgi:hypothetical protein